MNKSELVKVIASIIYDAGIRFKHQSDSGAMIDVKKGSMTRNIIVNKFREMMGDDVEVTINLIHLPDNQELMHQLVYSAIYEDIDMNYGPDIDEALWHIQRDRRDDYSQEQEDNARRRFGNE